MNQAYRLDYYSYKLLLLKDITFIVIIFLIFIIIFLLL